MSNETHMAQAAKDATGQARPCKCGSRLFSKITEMRGPITTMLTVMATGEVKSKVVANHVRVEREPKRMQCEGCGRRYEALNAPISGTQGDRSPIAVNL